MSPRQPGCRFGRRRCLADVSADVVMYATFESFGHWLAEGVIPPAIREAAVSSCPPYCPASMIDCISSCAFENAPSTSSP